MERTYEDVKNFEAKFFKRFFFNIFEIIIYIDIINNAISESSLESIKIIVVCMNRYNIINTKIYLMIN